MQAGSRISQTPLVDREVMLLSSSSPPEVHPCQETKKHDGLSGSWIHTMFAGVVLKVVPKL